MCTMSWMHVWCNTGTKISSQRGWMVCHTNILFFASAEAINIYLSYSFNSKVLFPSFSNQKPLHRPLHRCFASLKHLTNKNSSVIDNLGQWQSKQDQQKSNPNLTCSQTDFALVPAVTVCYFFTFYLGTYKDVFENHCGESKWQRWRWCFFFHHWFTMFDS